MAKARIKAVVFDIGGVLLDWDPRHLYRQLIPDPVQLDDFLDRICTRQWHLAHDLGEDTEQSCRELAANYPEYAELIMAWSRRGEEMIGGVLTQTVEVLSELRSARVRCFALSNMEPEKFVLRRARYDFFALLEGCVISGVEGVAKPDQKIFEILLSRYGLEPATTVFIDDVPANVAVARELGVVAIQFTTAAQLRSDLRDLGLPVGAPT
ncbi:MAG TPA: HAD family phosphatase [Streptosporangiaceae bacterium]|nr:HAD family phosphatase [Streptosporangiaceae bacterium]